MKRVTYLLILGLLFLGADPGIKSSQESAVKPTAISQSSLAFGLLVDNSGSVRQHFSDVIDVSKGIVEHSQPGDTIFLVRFVNVEVIQIVRDFTSQKVTLRTALDEMYVEGGLSAITDALYVAAEHLAKDAEKNNSDGHKRALVVITDGADENSFFIVEKLWTLLREKQIRVYAVGFPQAVTSRGIRFEERARKYLTTLAEKSGGRVYFPATAADIKSVSSSLMNDMRNQ